MKIGDKIISDKYNVTPKGKVFTVVLVCVGVIL